MTGIKKLANLDKVMSRERPHNRTEKKEYFESEAQTNPRQTNWFWDFPKTLKIIARKTEILTFSEKLRK
ncbi:hypothetical protein CLI64_25335 [Nostoc sp. CENA543]|nr:hypothetical protein CLI64_17080 [Nostoc sp. CENA543]AUT03464.1 hypothetical protein CLI64_25335 [Nostoc sp. CENA543]